MDNYDKTSYFGPGSGPGRGPGSFGPGPGQGPPSPGQGDDSFAILSVFAGSSEPVEYDLRRFGKGIITFGRGENNDIVIRSQYASRNHGQFRLINNRWLIEDLQSTNGLIIDNQIIKQKFLEDGDSVRIDDMSGATVGGTLLVFSTSGGSAEWKTLPLNAAGVGEIIVGRGEDCQIRLDHISVSRHHAKIVAQGGKFYLIDAGSTNGVIINGKKAEGKTLLHEKDLIVITNSKLIFSEQRISYCCFKKGISLDAFQVVKRVDKGKIICSGVDLHIRPGEMIAIVGGSGAGKSTVMNCLNGYTQPTSGHVLVNGLDLYENFDTMKNIIGFVPQSDIVFDNLTVYDMLLYAAQLRLPKDVSAPERLRRIEEVIALVELTERKTTLIKRLSGGQRKRASIAVELLSDPNLFFLDEPASGLDPGTERNLMGTLKNMSAAGKTVIFVTHSTLNLHMCDKIAFMGAGGHLCFYGSYNAALAFFGVNDVVDIYNLITRDPIRWRDMYVAMQQRPQPPNFGQTAQAKKSSNKDSVKQTFILMQRHLHILMNDKVRFLIIMLQAPLLALLISLVADGNQYKAIEQGIQTTQGLLFSVACAAFWIGLSNSIQEICKERNIVKREYMTGQRLGVYITSKVLYMSLLCAVQSFVFVSIYAVPNLVGLPSASGVMMPPFLEMLITVFLTALAASATGLFVSALFKNADRAMSAAPLLLMPQLLFAGLIFPLSNVGLKFISVLTTCRWAMEGLGATADLNGLYPDSMDIPDPPPSFEVSETHQLQIWLILAAFVVVFVTAAWIVLQSLNRERKK
ncbi:MAG: ATP-binding cassette domain-containing protein [Peptococcaceae bacterium]|nr:ATP-binding cassette domain-containing protein [Peptococcaceae bacterium]